MTDSENTPTTPHPSDGHGEVSAGPEGHGSLSSKPSPTPEGIGSAGSSAGTESQPPQTAPTPPQVPASTGGRGGCMTTMIGLFVVLAAILGLLTQL